MKRLVPLAACLLLGLNRLPAATLVQLSLSDMIGQSTAIEHAKVATSWAAFSGPVIYTHYRLQVSERWKGPAITEIVVFGGIANGIRQAYAGTPQLNPGEDYVFFLWTNKAGMTHVVGMTQGLFAVARDGSADPALTRAASSEHMLDARTGRQVHDQTLALKLSDLRARVSSELGAGKAAR
ncbi:MAG TPA: hypothetical protein VKF41_10510 [Bryobacteraceae bacterium]|nr:hypothetical protein [Bryobacteraceae bacterium]